MTAEHNFPVRVLEALQANPDGVALEAGAQRLSNGQVANLARRYASHMALRGVDSSSCVVIALRNGPTAFIAALAANLLGARWVGMHSRLPFQALHTTHLLHGPDLPAGFQHPGKHLVDASWAQDPKGMPGGALRSFPGFASPEDLAFYTRSSGTTGTPKFMSRRCGHFTENAGRNASMGFAAKSFLPPMLSSWGYRETVGGMMHGVRVVLADIRPETRGQVTALQQAGVEYVSGSPQQVDAICADQAPLAQRIRMLRVGGSVIDKHTLRHWLGYFEEICVAYASREASRVGELRLREVNDDTEIAYVLQEGCSAEIVSPEGEVLPHSTPGILRLRTSVMAKGYIGAPEATAEMFRDGWFYPGDIGELTADGRLKILGRVKDQLNIGGVKFNASDVDTAVRDVAGVTGAMCFAAAEGGRVPRLMLALTVAGEVDRAEIAAAARAALQRINRSLSIEAIYFLHTLPTNENGKLMREDGPILTKELTRY